MPPIHRLLLSLNQKKPGRQLLYIVSFLVFFWTVFDLIISYLVPILITERGFSNSEMGLIISFSSIAGAIFDFFLIRLLKHTNYLKTFFLILIIAFIFPFVLWYSQHIFVYLLAMAIWGLYYDLYTFASYDFVSRNNDTESQHSHDFGVIELFRSLGGLVAPLIITVLVIGKLNFTHFIWPLLFLVIAFVFYILLFSFSPLHHFHAVDRRSRSVNFFVEVNSWRRLCRTLFPVLLFMISIYVFDATFWTIGPLFSDNFPSFPNFSGYLMTLYSLPSLLTAWRVEYLTQKFGKKRTAYVSFLFANIFLIPIGFVNSPWLVLLLVFLSAIATSITWPSIEGAFADYAQEAGHLDTEVEGITDLTTNIGYIIGPIFAGVFSDKIGISLSFGVLGIVNVAIVILLFFVTPRHIRISPGRR